MKTAIAVLLLALAGGTAIMLAGGAAMAQSLVPQSSVSRYAMQPVEGGVARLDTQTGEMSLCQIEDGRMTCETSEEERAQLEQRIRELSDAAPAQRYGSSDEGDAAPSTPAPAAKRLPDDAELDRALGQMKHIFRTFRDLARELGDETPAPDRT